MKHSYLLSHLSSHINLLFPHMILISEADIPLWRRQYMNMEMYERVAFDLVAGESTEIDAL